MTQTLQAALMALPRPLDLWLVNFSGRSGDLDQQNCEKSEDSVEKVPGYRFRRYRCS
ncbi:MAG: hypothetical protein HC890_09405 [Chloroflexaceae bacterium]|nr:hypothetical protein [Chloroflexaceae bacterium]